MAGQFVRCSLVVLILASAGLGSNERALAEGGDGASIVLPDAAESVAATTESEAAQAVPPEEAEPSPLKKSGKALGRDAARKAFAASDDGMPQDVAARVDAKVDPKPAARKKAEPVEGEEAALDQTAALPTAYPTRWRGQQQDAIRSSALRPLIVRYAQENGLPFGLADAVVRLESRYNPGARNGPNVGLTQINVQTARSLGYQGEVSGLLDAETNLRFGLRYLAQAHRLAGGDTCGTILRYQFGHRTQTMTQASRVYCAKVKTIIAAAD